LLGEAVSDPFLAVEDIYASYRVSEGTFLRRTLAKVHAVDGVSLALEKGEALGLVGESGCGKTTLARVILQLLRPKAGRVLFDGRDLTRLGGGELRGVRRRMQLVFQDPYDSLDARMTVGDIIGEGLDIHALARGPKRRARIAELMDQVGLDPKTAGRYPREFSGGQRQRISIARALAVEPELLVLDEPVSALDVSVQAQIVNLLDDLRREQGLTFLFIAHDLAVVRQVCDRIAVMYLGKIVEIGDTEQVSRRPLHPYTQALLSAVPVPDPEVAQARRSIPLRAEMPSSTAPPPGCRFHTRCPIAQEVCKTVVPALDEKEPRRRAACHFVERTDEGPVAPNLLELLAKPV
jgi:oligopeptide transport system ATP-binding protein